LSSASSIDSNRTKLIGNQLTCIDIGSIGKLIVRLHNTSSLPPALVINA